MLLFGAALVLIGCAPTVWVHPRKNRQHWYADRSECEARAGQAAAGAGSQSPETVRYRVFHHCMFGKGWRFQKR